MDVEVIDQGLVGSNYGCRGNRPRAGRGVIMDVEVIDQGLVGE